MASYCVGRSKNQLSFGREGANPVCPKWLFSLRRADWDPMSVEIIHQALQESWKDPSAILLFQTQALR